MINRVQSTNNYAPNFGTINWGKGAEEAYNVTLKKQSDILQSKMAQVMKEVADSNAVIDVTYSDGREVGAAPTLFFKKGIKYIASIYNYGVSFMYDAEAFFNALRAAIK